ncbi:hypothetical protein, partial [Sandarakinorhabdus rubra]|uniref:hypothetical protein n=1 Tax=Sandarakinorhabdus rubra TaxID=2672568 RepID=UPI0013DA05E0
LGPIAAVPTQWRPTRSCPGGSITALIRLEGANAGLADVAVKPLSPGISVRPLDEDAPTPAESPSAKGCFAHTCRLLTLTVAADATDPARLELAIADGARLVVPVPLTTHCPDSAARAALLAQP